MPRAVTRDTLSPVLLHLPPYHQSILQTSNRMSLIKCKYDLVSLLLKIIQQAHLRKTLSSLSLNGRSCAVVHTGVHQRTYSREKPTAGHSMVTQESSRRKFFSLCPQLIKLLAIIDTHNISQVECNKEYKFSNREYPFPRITRLVTFLIQKMSFSFMTERVTR